MDELYEYDPVTRQYRRARGSKRGNVVQGVPGPVTHDTTDIYQVKTDAQCAGRSTDYDARPALPLENFHLARFLFWIVFYAALVAWIVLIVSHVTKPD